MNITIITSPFSSIPPNTIGAVERLWYNIAKIFVKKEHSVSFVSKCFDDNDKNGINADGIYIYYIKGFKGKKHIVSNLFFDFIYSIRALLKMRKSEILVMNTFWTPVFCIMFKNKFKISIYNVERFPKKQFFMYKFIDRLSCVSFIVQNELIKQSPSARRKVKVIHNPINTEIFTNIYQERNDNQIKLIYTGRVHPEKGLDILVKSFVILKEKYINIELTIVGAHDIARGGGGEEYMYYLVYLAGKHKIEFIDAIYDQTKLRNEIACHDIYVYPSVAEKGETFGVAPLEAMATGIPTIVSALECFHDFVADGDNALIFNHRLFSPEKELCNKIEELITNKDLRKKISTNGAKTAKENFNVEKIAGEYIQDFYELLNNCK